MNVCWLKGLPVELLEQSTGEGVDAFLPTSSMKFVINICMMTFPDGDTILIV